MSRKRTGGGSGPPKPRDPYAVLGIPRQADDADIKNAYFQGVRRHPPEREPEKFQEIRDAYERLRTPEARARTDLFLLQPPAELPGRRPEPYDLALHREDVVALAWARLLARLAREEEFRTPPSLQELGP
jgi:curved DNA-binding protein CbpA